MEQSIVYFDNPGTANTEETFQIAKKRAKEVGIKTVVVASTSGETAVKAADFFKGMKIIAVSHSVGFTRQNFLTFTEENRKLFESKGGIKLTCTHAFRGLGHAMMNTFKTPTVGDIVANTLRTLGQGMKVVSEITMMAADAGLVRTDEDIVVTAGTGHGADTAVILTPVNTQNYFALKVKEILCKPHF